MDSSGGHLVVRRLEGVIVVQFGASKIIDEKSVAEIGKKLDRLASAGPSSRLLLNFENVDQLSSSALGMLITLNRGMKMKGGVLKLCGIHPQVFQVFSITRLDRMFEIFSDEEQALASFNAS